MGQVATCCTNRDDKEKAGAVTMLPADGLQNLASPEAKVTTQEKLSVLHAKVKEHGAKHLETAKNYDY